MGKYAQAIGKLHLNIGGVQSELIPQMGDNQKLANIVSGYQTHKSQARMLKETSDFVYDLICRSDSSLTDDDKEELRLAIELNQMKVMEEIMIAFRWTTEDDVVKAKKQTGDVLKNLTGAGN